MVRTSLDPALQLAAEKALRDGLMAYDRSWAAGAARSGTSTAGPALTNGLGRAARAGSHGRRACCRSGGSPSCWRPTARRRLGWLERLESTRGRRRSRAPGALAAVRYRLGAAGAGRQARAGSPRRMADVVQPGDVVMIEPNAGCRRPPAPDKRRRAGAASAAARDAAADPGGAGRAGLARPDHRAGARHGRRLELRAEPVQPRDPGAAPARLQLQAVRLSDRAGAGHLAEPALPRRADRHGHGGGSLAAEQLSDGLQRPDARCASRWRSR